MVFTWFDTWYILFGICLNPGIYLNTVGLVAGCGIRVGVDCDIGNSFYIWN